MQRFVKRNDEGVVPYMCCMYMRVFVNRSVCFGGTAKAVPYGLVICAWFLWVQCLPVHTNTGLRLTERRGRRSLRIGERYCIKRKCVCSNAAADLVEQYTAKALPEQTIGRRIQRAAPPQDWCRGLFERQRVPEAAGAPLSTDLPKALL